MAFPKPTIDLVEAIFSSSPSFSSFSSFSSSQQPSSSVSPPSSTTNFIPCPQITLYCLPSATTTPTALGTCTICHANPLTIFPTDTLFSPTCPSSLAFSSALTILPCGHVACAACIQSSLSVKPNECPFCRFHFAYELCAHPAKGKIITRKNLLQIPDTVPMGGRVAEQCPECRERTNRVVSEAVLDALVGEIARLQEKYRRVGSGGRAVAVDAVDIRGAKTKVEKEGIAEEVRKARMRINERKKEAIRASLASLHQQFKLVTHKLSVGAVELRMLW
ncbi:hypothetical protein BD289DRAFT_479340 [Coniella lustricola]|uniref:RING-type domain-containing protein n=1 Tax=Coniella lustricola TaxID=2025994 RepID=A0A2T3AJ94_9PEZI|nr:hypothetical protein BD289DRAFT_479340 [Coniella lustricola]